MEFQATNHTKKWWWIGRLVSNNFSEGYESIEGYWPRCRVRQNHIHFYLQGCVLPEGLRLRLHFFDNRPSIIAVTGCSYWDSIQKKDIAGFECLGPGVGYKYGWENNE